MNITSEQVDLSSLHRNHLEIDELEVDQQELVLVVVFYITEKRELLLERQSKLTIEHDEPPRLQEREKRD